MNLDTSTSYGSSTKGVLVQAVDVERDNANVVFGLGKGEAAIYGGYNVTEDGEQLTSTHYNSGCKIKMDDKVLTLEILKLFR